MRFFVAIFILSFHLLAFDTPALNLKPYPLSSESTLHTNYGQKIAPNFQQVALEYFIGENNIKIAYKLFKVKNPKATVVISSGRTESMIKYQELIYDLMQNSYNVYILDHRGQGFSGRIYKQDSQIGHVHRFENYVKDLDTFVESIVKKQGDEVLFLLAHSMGGAIASLYLEQHHGVFKAAVLSSPMHEANLFTSATSKMLCEVIHLYNIDNVKYAPAMGPYDGKEKKIDDNIYSHSNIRYVISLQENEIYPQTKIGGPSVEWVLRSCEASALSIQQASKITTPILILQAGGDRIVNLKPQEKFCKNASSYCKGYTIPGAEHELFIEKDSYRVPALSLMFSFFDEHLKP